MRLLLDENLSPQVSETLACEDGVDACHVRDRGMLGADDGRVLDRAYAEDRILATANVEDFEALARQRSLHVGIVLIECPTLPRDQQLVVMRNVVAKLATETDLINHVLRVRTDGSMTVEPRSKT